MNDGPRSDRPRGPVDEAARLNAFAPPGARVDAASQRPLLWLPLAFTLLEIMIVVAIIGTLASLAVPALTRAVAKTQVLRAINDIKTIETDIELFEMAEGQLPVDLNQLGRDQLKDPWGRPYVYLSFAAAGPSWKGKARKDHSLVPLNSSYDLYSVGKDGKSVSPLTAKASDDDIVRALDGGFIGLGADF